MSPPTSSPTYVSVRRGLARRSAATALGLLLDRSFGEPPARVHPVAAFGRAMTTVERLVWSDRRRDGMAYTAIGVTLGSLTGAAIRSTAAAVATVTAGRELRRVAASIGEACARDDLDDARAELPSLVGRDPHGLDASAIAAAVIESLAENSVDAVVAPVFWAVVAGAPGAAGYRAVNTMDAMVGHHSLRYERFGWASARLDDIANYLPARLFALAVAATNPGRARAVWLAIRHDAPAHPSPNAGVAEAAVAAALGCQLGGALRYGERHEDRPVLGSGSRPQPVDIAAAIRIVDRTELAVVVALAALGALGALGAGGLGPDGRRQRRSDRAERAARRAARGARGASPRETTTDAQPCRARRLQ